MTSILGKLGRVERLREARGGAAVDGAPVGGPKAFEAADAGAGERRIEPAGRRLDFDSVVGAAGMLHVRRAHEPVGTRVGLVPLADALEADSRLLARLCLTPEVEGLPLERALFLDTETTGLGGGTGNRAFLVGMCFFDPVSGGFALEQLLLRDPDDEAAMLDRVRSRLDEAAFVVTYNGKSFDLPLLRARSTLARLGALPERPHLDLLHVARRMHDRRGWKMSLGVVEREVLGFDRGPDIHGAEVAMRYAEYLFGGDEGCLAEAVTHNRHDVWTLVALLGHYGRAGATGRTIGRPLEAPELSGMARVLRRAGELEWAMTIADRAVADAGARLQRGEADAEVGELDALWTRARIAKSRGDRAAALADLEKLLSLADDADARLELAKLYEHFVKDPVRALALAERGTGEAAEDLARRRDRLHRKVAAMRR